MHRWRRTYQRMKNRTPLDFVISPKEYPPISLEKTALQSTTLKPTRPEPRLRTGPSDRKTPSQANSDHQIRLREIVKKLCQIKWGPQKERESIWKKNQEQIFCTKYKISKENLRRVLRKREKTNFHWSPNTNPKKPLRLKVRWWIVKDTNWTFKIFMKMRFQHFFLGKNLKSMKWKYSSRGWTSFLFSNCSICVQKFLPMNLRRLFRCFFT